MDLETVEPALLALLATLTGLPAACCVKDNAPRPVAPAVALLSLVSFTSRGVDATEWTYAAAADALQEMTPSVSGLREAVYQVSVEVYADQRSGYDAPALVERARTRLRWPSSLAALRAVSCALATVGPATRADYRADQRMVSRALFEVRLNAAAAEADTSGRTSYIATVDVTGAVQEPDGTDAPETLQPTTG